jgi:PmbA protein
MPSAVTDLTTTRPELEALVARILAEAKARGATQAEAGVSIDAGLSVNVRLGEVETLEYQRDRALGVTVYFGQRKASASSADLSERAVAETVEKACSIARFTAEDPCAGLAEAELLERNPPDLDLSHPWELSAEQAIDLARECEDAARAEDPRITNSEGASLSTHRGLRAYGNSHGFLGSYPSSRHGLSCAVLGEQDGAMERDYWYTTARDPVELEGAASVGRRAALRTVARLGARKLGTCRAPVLFPAELARGFFGHFLGAIRGSAQYREASFLLNAAGQRVFAEHVEIVQRPHIPKGLASAPFDNEGVVTRDRDLVQRGVLQGYVMGSYSARKLGLQTTGNAGGVWNLLVTPGSDDFDALLRRMGRGLLLGELMGHGVNNVTGDYSRGAAGYWVEDGEIQHPVNEITIAGNLKDLYRQIVAIGTDTDLRGAVRTGSILVEEMTIAGE